MLISTKNGRTGIVRAIALAICVVMLVAFAAGCSDEHAQSLANAAQTAADKAAEAAKEALEAANQAQGTADQAKQDAAAANTNADSKFTADQVEAAIMEILKDYIKAEDAATKAQLAEISAQLANYLTEDAVKALISAAAASKEDLETAKQDILDEIQDVVDSLESYYTKAAIDEILKKYYTSENIDEALADYYVKTKVDELVAGAIDPAELAAAIGASEETIKILIATYVDPTELATELAKYYTAEQIDDKFITIENAEKLVEDMLTSYVTKDELAGELQFLSGELYGLGGTLRQLQSKLVETADKTLADANAYADSLVNAYNDLTPLVVKNYLELMAQQEAYLEENAYLYDAEGLKAVYNKYTTAGLLLIRATSEEAIKAVMISIESSIDAIVTIPDQLYAAILAVEATKNEGYIVIAAGTSTADSGSAIAAARVILDKAIANKITVDELNAYVNADGETVALATLVEGYEDTYANLVAAKNAADNDKYTKAEEFDANAIYFTIVDDKYVVATVADADAFAEGEYYVCNVAVNNLIKDLENYAEYKADTIEVLTAKVSLATNAYNEWLAAFFAEDHNDVNIKNIIYNYDAIYSPAVEHLANLTGLDDTLDAFIAEIEALLGENGTKWYANGYVLYTTLGSFTNDEATGLVDRINAANEVLGFIGVLDDYNDFGTKYADLLAAEAYAKKAVAMYDAFVDETDDKSVYTYLVELVALERRLGNSTNYGVCMGVLNAWMMDENDEPKIDMANVVAIVNSNEATSTLAEDVELAVERFEQLADAYAAALLINLKIDEYFDADGNTVLTYKDMHDLELIWDEIYGTVDATTGLPAGGWFQIYEIATDAKAEDYFADNYNMIDHDKLIKAIEDCQAIIDEILADENLQIFKNIIIKFKNEYEWSADHKQLYYNAEYQQARTAYTNWVNKWLIEDITLATFDGGNQQGTVDTIASYFKDLNDIGTAIDNEIKAATEEDAANASIYLIFKNELAKFNGDYVPALTGSEWVVNAWKAANDWAIAHTDALKGGFTEVIDAYGLLTKAEYDEIKAVYDEYAEYVKTATADLKTLIAELMPYMAEDYVMNLITDPAAIRDIYAAYNNANGWKATYAVENEADITDADLKALAEKFNTDVNAVVAALEAFEAAFKRDLEALNFDAMLEMFESDDAGKVINIYSKLFGELKTLRDGYNALADKYFEGANTSAAFDNANQFTALAIWVKRLEAQEARVDALAKAKNEEKQDIIDAINAIVANGVTTDDKAALEEVAEALEAWLAEIIIDNEKKFVGGIYLTKDIISAVNTFSDAEEEFDDIMDLLAAAKDAIEEFETVVGTSPAKNPSDTAAKELYDELYNAAKDAVDAFVKANGSLGTATLEDDYRITEDEQAILAAGKLETDAYAYLAQAWAAYYDAVSKYIDDQGKTELEDEFALELELTLKNIRNLVAAEKSDAAAVAAARLASELEAIATAQGSTSETPSPDDTKPDIYPED